MVVVGLVFKMEEEDDVPDVCIIVGTSSNPDVLRVVVDDGRNASTWRFRAYNSTSRDFNLKNCVTRTQKGKQKEIDEHCVG